MRAAGEAHREAEDAQLEVLWAGDDARVREALVQLGVRVTRVHPDRCLQRVATRAPDMLVLSGAAAARADAVVRELRAHQPGASLPVTVISRDEPAPPRGGLVARLSAELPPSALAAEIYERLGAATSLSRLRELAISAGELDAWLSSARAAESSGFLLTGAGAIAFGPDGRALPSLDHLHAALAQLPSGDASPVKLLELPANRLRVLSGPPEPAAGIDLTAARICVVYSWMFRP